VCDAVFQELGQDVELADEDGDGCFVEGRHFCFSFCGGDVWEGGCEVKLR
jgi:hypothetical protein